MFFRHLYPQEPTALICLLYSPFEPDTCWELDAVCLSFQLTSYRTAQTHLRSRMVSWSTQTTAWASRSPLSATQATSCWAILCSLASMALTGTGTTLSHGVTVGSSSPLGTVELLLGSPRQELFSEHVVLQEFSQQGLSLFIEIPYNRLYISERYHIVGSLKNV